jgi:hypothetical protein
MPPAASRLRPLRWLAWAMAGISLFFVFHNYGFNLLPYSYRTMLHSAIKPWVFGDRSVAYYVDFSGSEPDTDYYRASRVEVFEDAVHLGSGHGIAEGIATSGGGGWAHKAHQIVFSTSDNSDPRTNNRFYTYSYPMLHHRWIGRTAAVTFALSLGLLWWLYRPDQPARARAAPGRHGWHFAAALVVFALGLYFTTGTLTPYAITSLPRAEPPHGYLYNTDHPHFATLFKFLDGAPRSEWDGAILFRRILYPVLAYPFMKVLGFELGGTVAGLLFNLAAFIGFVRFLRREVGAAGASLGAWLLALYPGAGYWSGLPYMYTMIVPCSLLLTVALWHLRTRSGWAGLVVVSLLMGTAYLAYDLLPVFLPASLLVLLVRRRWLAIPVSAVLQVLPLGAWLFFLSHGLQQNLANSNTDAIGAIVNAYLHPTNPPLWRIFVEPVPDIALNVFFGSNFIFPPLLFLGLLAVNAATSRIAPTSVEAALLTATVCLFLFINLAPPYNAGWVLRGNWISRVYQPVFPILILFAARWRQALPALGRGARTLLIAGGLAYAACCSLVVFGPALRDPFHFAEEAYYRFYDLSIGTGRYNLDRNLQQFGVHPLGF